MYVDEDRCLGQHGSGGIVAADSSDQFGGSRTSSTRSTAASVSQMRQKMLECPHLLQDMLLESEQADFRPIATVLSCVLNKRGKLSRRALQEAVELHARLERRSAPIYNEQLDFQEWLKRLYPVIATTSAGHIEFGHRAMPSFLHAYPLRGIDASHRILAMLCLAQRRLDMDSRRYVLGDGPSKHSFALYAATHWQSHCRIARQSSLFIGLARFDIDKERDMSERGLIKQSRLKTSCDRSEEDHCEVVERESSDMEDIMANWELVGREIS